jgi:hypothetical protein
MQMVLPSCPISFPGGQNWVSCFVFPKLTPPPQSFARLTIWLRRNWASLLTPRSVILCFHYVVPRGKIWDKTVLVDTEHWVFTKHRVLACGRGQCGQRFWRGVNLRKLGTWKHHSIGDGKEGCCVLTPAVANMCPMCTE